MFDDYEMTAMESFRADAEAEFRRDRELGFESYVEDNEGMSPEEVAEEYGIGELLDLAELCDLDAGDLMDLYPSLASDIERH